MNVNKDDLAKLGYEYTLTPDEDAFLVRFPGVPQLISAGHSLAQAHAMAKDAVELWLGEMVPGSRRRWCRPSRSSLASTTLRWRTLCPLETSGALGQARVTRLASPSASWRTAIGCWKSRC